MASIALISFFIAAHLLFLKYGVFFISLSTDLHPDQTTKLGDAAARDRWGE